MSLMHDALKEMDKPRPDSTSGSQLGIPAIMLAEAETSGAVAGVPSKSQNDDITLPMGSSALEWRVAKISGDAHADAYASEESASSRIAIIAWLLAGILCVLLALLWWMQSRHAQQNVQATERIAIVSPSPQAPILTPTLPVVPPVSASQIEAITAVAPVALMPQTPTPQPDVARPSVMVTQAVPSPIVAAAASAIKVDPFSVPAATAPSASTFSRASAAGAALKSAAGASAIVEVVNPNRGQPTVTPSSAFAVVPAPAKAPTTVPQFTRETLKSANIPTKDMPRPRTAILSTTTLPVPVAEAPTIIAAPDAVSESKVAAVALAGNTRVPPIASHTPITPNAGAAAIEAAKPPAASAKQLATQAGLAALETIRKENEVQQNAAARVATSKNAATRYASIGRALAAGDRAAAQNALNSLEQELPPSSLTLLRARAWIAGSGADVAAARNAYNAILVRLPDDENALLNMAALEAKDGKMDIARSLVAQTLSAHPESVAAKAAHQRLASLTAQVR